MSAQIDLDEVRRALTTSRVLDYYAWSTKNSGSELESKSCPIRADHSRRALVISKANGRWKCFVCDESGDLFDFIALREGLEIDTEFGAVKAKAAEIAGVIASELNPDERRRQQAEWARKRVDDEAKEKANRAIRDAAAVPKATSFWGSLADHDERGLRYLADRGVIDAIRFDDLLRFDVDKSGSPALKLYASNGSIRNVVERRLPELGEPKTPGLWNCPSAGTLVNSIKEVSRNPGRDVVLTEGVFDSITATLAWPHALVLGAHGAGNLAKVARMAAPEIAKSKGRMFLVPHGDDRGFHGSLEAAQIAITCGLSMRSQTLHVIDVGAKDLNDAWRSGWRPCA